MIVFLVVSTSAQRLESHLLRSTHTRSLGITHMRHPNVWDICPICWDGLCKYITNENTSTVNICVCAMDYLLLILSLFIHVAGWILIRSLSNTVAHLLGSQSSTWVYGWGWGWGWGWDWDWGWGWGGGFLFLHAPRSSSVSLIEDVRICLLVCWCHPIKGNNKTRPSTSSSSSLSHYTTEVPLQD